MRKKKREGREETLIDLIEVTPRSMGSCTGLKY